MRGAKPPSVNFTGSIDAVPCRLNSRLESRPKSLRTHARLDLIREAIYHRRADFGNAIRISRLVTLFDQVFHVYFMYN